MCPQQFIRRRTRVLESHLRRHRRDPLTIGDIPITCMLDWYNRQTVLVPALGRPTRSRVWPIARLLRKKADQRAKLEASFQKRKVDALAPILPH